jgi:hypothetical protein
MLNSLLQVISSAAYKAEFRLSRRQNLSDLNQGNEQAMLLVYVAPYIAEHRE